MIFFSFSFPVMHFHCKDVQQFMSMFLGFNAFSRKFSFLEFSVFSYSQLCSAIVLYISDSKFKMLAFLEM